MEMKAVDVIERMDTDNVQVKEYVLSLWCKGLKLFGVEIV